MLSFLGCLKMGENIFISLPCRLSIAWNVLFFRLNPFFETYILNHFRKIGMRSIVELSSIVERWAGIIFFGSLLQIIPAEMVTEVGDPKEAICAAVENLNIQLLVLGSHSRGVIKRLVAKSYYLCSFSLCIYFLFSNCPFHQKCMLLMFSVVQEVCVAKPRKL